MLMKLETAHGAGGKHGSETIVILFSDVYAKLQQGEGSSATCWLGKKLHWAAFTASEECRDS
jgi:hypothetical protein